MMRDILILGTIVAVVILLIRIVLTTPFAMSYREAFVDSARPINSTVTCPANTQLYMYGGAPYCCSGTVNASAARLVDTCKPTGRRDDTLTFCTLGPQSSVKNCLSLRSGLLAAKGADICPKGLPTYVSSDRCCADAGNHEMNACTSANYCDATSDPNYFKQAGSCQFRKAQEEIQCPTGFGVFTAPGQGPMSNITLMGCTDNGRNCYPDSTLKRLKELGYDVTGLPNCSQS
jgi:hypothetical protein